MYDVVLSKSRKFFNRNIKPVVRVEYCEVCNEVNDLHIHHNEPLSITVRKMLSEFDIENVDVLVDLVSARSLREGLTVVCPECHRELHKDDMGDLVSYGMTVETLKEKKEREKRARELEAYLDSLVGKRLYKEDREELINKINLRKNGKMLKSISVLSEHLLNAYDGKYILSNKTNYRKRDKSKYRKTYWIING